MQIVRSSFSAKRVDGIEVRIVQSQIAFHAAKEHSHRALLFRPFHFRQRGLDIAQRQDRDPFEPIRRLGAGIGDEAVISAAQGDLEFRIVGKINQKQRRIDHLNLDTELVHVFEPRQRIGQFAHARDEYRPCPILSFAPTA